MTRFASLSSPVMTAFPSLGQGRLPHCSFRGLLSVHSRYGPHSRRVAKPPLYTRGFQPLGYLPRLLQLLPAGAKVAGGDLHPLKDRAFARRTLTTSPADVVFSYHPILGKRAMGVPVLNISF